MKNLSDQHDQVSHALQALMDSIFANPAVVSVTHSFEADEPTLLVGVLHAPITELASTVEIRLDDGTMSEFRVEQYVTEPIEPDILIAEKALELLNLKATTTTTMGGDWCQNVNSDGYGTVTVTASQIEIEAVDGNGHRIYHCVAAPGMLSNNHVIARSDAAAIGELIKTAARNPFSALACFVPLSDTRINIDAGTATIQDTSVASFIEVRGVGKITGIRKPRPNEHIRKSGARTGVTAGNIIGRTNFRSGGRTFYGAWRESNGMSCRGDSGAPVLSDSMELIGVHTWGVGDECNPQRECYFFDLVDQRQLVRLISDEL